MRAQRFSPHILWDGACLHYVLIKFELTAFTRNFILNGGFLVQVELLIYYCIRKKNYFSGILIFMHARGTRQAEVNVGSGRVRSVPPQQDNYEVLTGCKSSTGILSKYITRWVYRIYFLLKKM